MINQFIIFLAILPILGSITLIVLNLRFKRIGWPFAAFITAIHLFLALSVSLKVFKTGVIRYFVGGFVPPFGIELVVDGFSAVVVLLVSTISFGLLFYTRRGGPRTTPFYSLYLLMVGGASSVSITGDLFNLYVFLEITSIAGYGLIAVGGDRATVASLKYLLIGSVGTGFFLLGVGYAFAATGTLNMEDLFLRLAEVGYRSSIVKTAFAFLFTGLAVKIPLFPLHVWQPDAYATSHDSVSALISTVLSSVTVYALGRVVFSVFSVNFLFVNPFIRSSLIFVAGVSVVAGSLLAVRQREVKRMLAYSSVSQLGLVVAAFFIANEASLIGGVLQLLGHALMKGGLFLAAGVVAVDLGARSVEEYSGVGIQVPVGGSSFSVLALSMVGVPPAVGFFGKFYMALGAVRSGSWFIAAVILVSTLLTLMYFVRLLERMYFRAGMDGAGFGDGSGVSLGMLSVVVVASVVVVVFGLASFWFYQLFEYSAASLLSL